MFVSQTVFATLIGFASEGVTNYFFLSAQGTSFSLMQQGQPGCLVDGSGFHYLVSQNDPSAVTAGSYTQYDNCIGLVVDGSASLKGVYFSGHALNEDAVRIDLTFSDLRYTRQSDGQVFHLAGTMRLAKVPATLGFSSESIPGFVATINASLSDSGGAPVFTLQDFLVKSAAKSPGTNARWLELSGRVVHPVLGFIDVVSPTKMVILPAGPSRGSFIIQGATEQAVVTYTDGVAATSIAPIPANGNTSRDPAFGTDGKTTTDFENSGDSLNALKPVSGGKFIASGSASGLPGGFSDTTIALARYNGDGSLDGSFGAGGKVRTKLSAGDGAVDVVEQPDGKLVVAAATNMQGGQRGIALVRYNADGSVDGTFGTGGSVQTYIGDNVSNGTQPSAFLRQPDGKFLVAAVHANNLAAVLRYNADGSLDGGFASAGIALTQIDPDFGSVRAMALQSDGKILVGGSQIVRYNPDGSLDTGFGTNGKVTAGVTGLVLLPDGKFVAGSAFALSRYQSDGSVDTTFGANGLATSPPDPAAFGSGPVALQSDGKLVSVASTSYGPFTRFLVVRFNSDGTPDTSFGVNGLLRESFGNADAGATALLVQSDGKLLVGGVAEGDFALVRYLP